jgi:hypothetical protein
MHLQLRFFLIFIAKMGSSSTLACLKQNLNELNAKSCVGYKFGFAFVLCLIFSSLTTPLLLSLPGVASLKRCRDYLAWPKLLKTEEMLSYVFIFLRFG